MNNLPSVKTHPVVMSLITVTFVLAISIVSAIGGWWLRAMSESRAELSVVVDDGKFMQALEVQTQKWVEEFNQWDEDFHNENKHIPNCISDAMPNYYHDADYRVRSTRQQAE